MAIVTASILFIIGVGLLTISFSRRLYSIRSNQQLEARCAADYGITKAVYAMNLWLNDSTSPLPAETEVTIPGSDSKYSYTVSKVGAVYKVQATGKSASISKILACDLRLKSAYEYAILTKNNLDIGSASKVDCIGCNNRPLKIGTTNNPNSNAVITLKPNAVVDGDILLGQGGIPSLVVGPGATYNNIYAVATDYDLPLPTVPDYLLNAEDKGAINNPASPLTTGKYSSLTLGSNKIANVTDPNGVALYITGHIILNTDSKIIVDVNSNLTIYLAGSLEGKNGCGFTNDTNDSTKLTIYGLGTGAINIKNSDEFYGTIYAPNADVYIYNGVKVQGSVIANDYKQDNNAKFTYDAALRTVTDTTLARFVPTHWREL